MGINVLVGILASLSHAKVCHNVQVILSDTTS